MSSAGIQGGLATAITIYARLKRRMELIRQSLEIESHEGLEEELSRWVESTEGSEPSLIMQLIKITIDDWCKFAKEDGVTLVYSLDKQAREMGYLRAGEASRGDRTVFVPGCYHHLVLRRQNRQEGVRWKLVGLEAMGTEKTRHRGCSETEGA
ncbi:hypothetical protein VTI74DRAFT_5114 [Chaetomium olivicolor]